MRQVANDIFNYFGLHAEDVVDHLLAPHTSKLTRCNACGANDTKHNGHHARHNFAISVGKIKWASLLGSSQAESMLVTILFAFLNEYQPRE